jgi:hypothetical protein
LGEGEGDKAAGRETDDVARLTAGVGLEEGRDERGGVGNGEGGDVDGGGVCGEIGDEEADRPGMTYVHSRWEERRPCKRRMVVGCGGH